MERFNPLIHHRRSIRLKGYDYSQPGLFFITICVQQMKCLFGHIHHGKMQLNDAGKMVEKWYWELENKFPNIKCHHMVVMPNHFHCIIESTPVGADLRVCPPPQQNPSPEHDSPDQHEVVGEHVGSPVHFFERWGVVGEHIGSPVHSPEPQGDLGDVVQWFKAMSTNEYIRGVKMQNWPRFDGKLWQRNYYEHIIRDENAFRNISNYIVNNPMKWNEDKFYL